MTRWRLGQPWRRAPPFLTVRTAVPVHRGAGAAVVFPDKVIVDIVASFGSRNCEATMVAR